MLDFFKNLFSSEFMPHGHCYMWQPEILWMHVLSDAIIALSYFSIPFALVYLVSKRRDLAFGKLFLLFGGFILLCGATHVLGIWSVWHGTYRLTGIVKVLTAIFSIFTAVLLWPTIPKILEIPSNEDLRRVNQLLNEEIDERKYIEAELKKHREQLELLVSERTSELEFTNERLHQEIKARQSAETEIKRSEVLYQELFKKYHGLYEYAPDMYASVDAKTKRITECNQTLADEIELSKSEIIGRPIFELYSSDCIEDVQHIFKTFTETGKVKNAELALKRKDGSKIDVILNASSECDLAGKIISCRSSWRDITALKLANQAVQDSVAHISAVLDTAVDAILTLDEGGIIESFNPAAERIFGYAAEEVIGNNIRLLIPASDKEKQTGFFHQHEDQDKEKVTGSGYEVEGRCINGHVFPIELSVSQFSIKNELRFTGIIRDITERKRLENIKDEFVSIVSHELRTPLTSINGSLGAMTAGSVGELSDMAFKMVSIAQRNCERLVRLINDLLDIQKMEAGKFEIVTERINLITLLERSIEANLGFGKNRGVRIELFSEAPALWIKGDPDRLLQVMANLISNAAKYSPADELVSVVVESTEQIARVNIIDRGEGIPAEYHELIFQKFTQVESSLKRSKGGTGLGLSITKSIVELHGGKIGFESEPGKGTTFFFELPLEEHVQVS